MAHGRQHRHCKLPASALATEKNDMTTLFQAAKLYDDYGVFDGYLIVETIDGYEQEPYIIDPWRLDSLCRARDKLSIMSAYAETLRVSSARNAERADRLLASGAQYADIVRAIKENEE